MLDSRPLDSKKLHLETEQRVYYFSDGCRADKLSKEVKDTLLGIGAIKSDSLVDLSKSVSFCGFLMTTEGLCVFLPKTSNILQTEQLLRDHARLLFRTLLKFSESSASRDLVGEEAISKNEREALNQISIQIQLIEDWIRYGIYKSSKKKVIISQSGKVDWNKTISSVIPLFNNNHIPVYPHFVINESKQHSATLIAQIHAWAVARADKSIGWLVSDGDSQRGLPELTNVAVNLPCSYELALRTLQRELRNQYNARNIWLLKLLIKSIQGMNRIGANQNFYGVLNFWRVWEAVCKTIIQDKYDEFESRIPQPVYIGNDNKPLQSSRARQIPDILSKQSDSISIIDAKYYDVSKNLPGWGDIVKQYYYAKTIKVAGLGPQVSNFFLFPQPHVMTRTPSKVELAVPDSKNGGQEELANSLNKEFPSIVCLYVDIYVALDAYLRKKKLDILPS